MSQDAQRGAFKVFNASNYRIGIVVSEFNSDVTEGMLARATEKLGEYSVQQSNIVVHRVPGSVEIPLVLNTMAKSKKFDCLIALGVVMRGETAHFDYVCNIVTDGVLRVMLDHSIPVGFGIVTCDTTEQAKARLSFGSHAVEAVLQQSKILMDYK
jgi:6,7-dimethyl-8-ribityllumazine synthase